MTVLSLSKSRFLTESVSAGSLSGYLAVVLLPAIVLTLVIPCRAGEADKRKALREVAGEWIQVGIEQHRRNLFDAAEESFRQAQGYQEYLTAAERDRLNDLLENARRPGPTREKASQDIQVATEPVDMAAGLYGVQNSQPPAREELRLAETRADAISLGRVALVPGDVIEVKFFYTPELDVTQTVRPDGMVALQLVGEVRAQGKTPSELQRELLGLYTSHLKDPDVTVIVRSFYDRRVFVGGQVVSPGIVQIPGKMDVLEAIMEAGGFDLREAQVQNVVVIRHKDGRRYGYSLDLKAALKGKRSQQFFLEPKDIVYVPRTKIAEVNQWIDQHINRLIPRTGFIFTVDAGDNARIGIY